MLTCTTASLRPSHLGQQLCHRQRDAVAGGRHACARQHRGCFSVRAGDGQGGDDPLTSNPAFMGVLQQSLARQGADALMSGPPEVPRISAVEEVLQTAVQQSKQTLHTLQVWKLQIEGQIAAQEKQVSRMEFALHKARSDAAYMKALKGMVYDSADE